MKIRTTLTLSYFDIMPRVIYYDCNYANGENNVYKKW